MKDSEVRLPKMALYLGYGGLLPFLALTLASIMGFQVKTQLGISTELWLAIYAATIISFLGAVHWGVVIATADQLTESENNTLLVYSVIPSLLAWFSFLFSLKLTLISLGLIVLFCFMVDHLILYMKLTSNIAKDFSRLRLHLTIIVSICLFVSAFSLS